MNSLLSTNQILEFSQFIINTCETILFRCGPFLKEGIYQDILVNELQNNFITTSREMVFPYQFWDTQNNPIYIGNSQSLRTDIELPTLGGILELKSGGSVTKPDNIFQLRNYLENRPDISWGILVNFISRFTQKASCKVTCTILIKGDESQTLDIRNSQKQTIMINQYYRYDLESLEYPSLEKLFIPLPQPNNIVDDSMMNNSIMNLGEGGLKCESKSESKSEYPNTIFSKNKDNVNSNLGIN